MFVDEALERGTRTGSWQEEKSLKIYFHVVADCSPLFMLRNFLHGAISWISDHSPDINLSDTCHSLRLATAGNPKFCMTFELPSPSPPWFLNHPYSSKEGPVNKIRAVTKSLRPWSGK